MVTVSKTNPKATAATLTGTSLSHRGIFNAKNTAKEIRLLQAQQDIQINEEERGDRAMLTEKWLENVSPHDPDDIEGIMSSDELETSTTDTEQHK
ncbi:hypothetical protein CIB48_g6132 [Xylaria polymorpha]|nr:hypothetical protein CIB48_g6132 [Xylaria polymorpha]